MSETGPKFNDNNRLADAKFGAAGDLLAMRIARQQEINAGPDS